MAAPGEGLPGWSERTTGLKDPDSRSFASCFYWTFLRLRGRSVRSYSAATSSRSSAQEAPDCSRIIPHTVSQHLPQLIVVSWCRCTCAGDRAPAAIASFTFAVFRALHTQMIMRTICTNVRTIVNRVLLRGACKTVAPRKISQNQRNKDVRSAADVAGSRDGWRPSSRNWLESLRSAACPRAAGLRRSPCSCGESWVRNPAGPG